MRKRWHAWTALALTVTFLVSACWGGEGDGADGEQDKTLTLWTWKVAYLPGFEAVAQLYEEKTGIKVDIEVFTPDDVYREKVRAAANDKSLPDIIHWWASAGTSLETSMVELSSVVEESTLNAYFDTAMDPIQVTRQQVDQWAADKDASQAKKSLLAGEIYGLPLDIGGFFTFFGNKKLIEQAGLEPIAPKTWEQFIAIMETIKKETGVPGLVYGGELPELWENWAGSALRIMLNGPEGYIDLLERKADMSAPENLKAIQAFGQLAEKDLLMPGVLSTDIDGADQAFASGRAAFDLGGSFTMSTLLAIGMNADDIIAFPVPPMADSRIQSWTTDPFTLTMMSANKDSKLKDDAIDFITFITSDPDAAVAFSNGAYTVSALKIGDRSAELTPSLRAIQESFATEPGPYSQVQPFVHSLRGEHKEWEEYYSSLQSLVEKKMTPEQVAAQFDRTKKTLLESGS